jgi:hypothetical protein
MTTPYIRHIGIIVTDPDQAIEKLRPLSGDPTRIKNLPEIGLRRCATSRFRPNPAIQRISRKRSANYYERLPSPMFWGERPRKK